MDLTKHAFFVGSTGSGKTVTTLFLVRELARLKVPFLIIEPVKTEYFQQVRDIPEVSLRRVRLEGTADEEEVEDFLAFDPMRLQAGVSVARHASYLKSCFEAAFPSPPESAESMILEAGIRSYYTEPRSKLGCGLKIFSRGGPGAHHLVERTPMERTVVVAGKEKREFFHRSGPVKLDEAKGEKVVGATIMRVHPSLEGFREFFSASFLPKMVKDKGGRRLPNYSRDGGDSLNAALKLFPPA